MRWTEIVKQAQAMGGTDEEKMLAKHMPLVKYVCRQLKTKSEDDRQVGIMALWIAVKRYDPSRAKFSTFACHAIRNAITNHQLRDTRVTRGGRVKKQTLVCDPVGRSEGLDLLDRTWARNLYRRMLPEDRPYVQSWCEGHTHQEVADKFGVTHSRVSQRISRALKTVRRKLEREELI